jgi:hypothetical protein
MGQTFIDGGEFLIAHSSERTPWHLLAHFIAVGIDARACSYRAAAGWRSETWISLPHDAFTTESALLRRQREHAAGCGAWRMTEAMAKFAREMGVVAKAAGVRDLAERLACPQRRAAM